MLKLLSLSFLLIFSISLYATNLPLPTDYRDLPSGRLGSAGFTVIGDLIYVLKDNGIKVFSVQDGTKKGEFAIPDYCEDISLNAGKTEFSFLSGRNIFVTDIDGRLKKTYALPSSMKAAWRIIHYKGHYVAVDPKGFYQAIDDNSIKGIGFPVSEEEIVNIQRASNGFTLNGKFYSVPDRGSILPLFKDKKGNIYIYVEKVYSKSPILAQGFLYVINSRGSILSRIELPLYPYALIRNPFFMEEDRLFVLLPDERQLQLYSYTEVELKGNLTYSFGKDEGKAFWKAWVGDSNEGNINTPVLGITRDQIMANAKPYESHTWTCASKNMTHGLIQDPQGKWIRTPSWVTEGAKVKIPYQWGGFSSISQFDSGLANRYAGDNYTDKSSASYYCIGVDCSGYVSRCWGTSQKYSTSTIPNISEALPSYSDMQRGDCLNMPASHVRLCAEDYPENSVLTLEASGADWRVSYRTYNFSSLSGYIPRKYNGTEEEGTTSGTFVVKVVNIASLPVRSGPGSGYSTICSIKEGYEYICTGYTADGWYKICIPSGTGHTIGWSYGGNGTDGYFTGHLETTYVRVRSGITLNVRTGPGTSYAIITTISSDQCFAQYETNGVWHHIWICNAGSYYDGWSSEGSSKEYLETIAGGPRGKLGATYVSQSYPASMTGGQKSDAYIDYQNIGENSWNANTRLGTTNPKDRESEFYTSGSWLSKTRPAIASNNALPGQKARFAFVLTAPNQSKEYTEYWNLVQDGYHWFSDSGHLGPADTQVYFRINVSATGFAGKLNPVKLPIPFEIGNVFPQPAHDKAMIKISLPVGENITFRIYDISGRMLSSEGFNLSSGYHTLTIPRVKGSGVYIIKIDTKRGTFVRRLTLLR